ncbi:cytochrome c oxidase subunit II [Paraconexibacter sp.]|uniref:cytochrome c oxidase subunit II n=1 Tax=Paraconexibacter sp. TaxID=2949640 RepID=UPI003565BABA
MAIGALLMSGAAPAGAGTLLPERGGSPNADRIASLYTVVLVLAGVVFVGVTVALVYALARYRASRSPVAAQIHGNTRLEVVWTVAATLLIVALAAYSLTKLGAIENPDQASAGSLAAAAAAGVPADERGQLRIEVIGRQYVWMFKYPNGAYSYEEMVAPVGVTVKLDIVSVDVAHSWWIPKLGGKFDALPGYVNHTWFRAKQAGVYRGQCAELCGRNHADMTAKVRAVPPAEYARWVARQKRLIDVAQGAVARRQVQP